MPTPASDPPPVDDAVIDWYESIENEADRLTRSPAGRLEAARTQEIVARYLDPQPMRVLDVGGASGFYARWLTLKGHAVHLVDPVPRHVRQAAEIPGVNATLGDARRLEVPDAAADLTLGLGPLYHLDEEADRVQALAEMRRATRPGGFVLAAGIGRFHVLSEFALLGEFSGELAERIIDLVGSGLNPNRSLGFPIRRAHTAWELQVEAEAAGLLDVQVFGIEGPAGAGVAHVPAERLDAVLEQSARIARLVEDEPQVRDTSAHLMVIGQVPPAAAT